MNLNIIENMQKVSFANSSEQLFSKKYKRKAEKCKKISNEMYIVCLGSFSSACLISNIAVETDNSVEDEF